MGEEVLGLPLVGVGGGTSWKHSGNHSLVDGGKKTGLGGSSLSGSGGRGELSPCVTTEGGETLLVGSALLRALALGTGGELSAPVFSGGLPLLERGTGGGGACSDVGDSCLYLEESLPLGIGVTTLAGGSGGVSVSGELFLFKLAEREGILGLELASDEVESRLTLV